MNLFEIILITLLGVYVLSSLYFNISGRILTNRSNKEYIERRNKDEEYENNINVLTKRVGEIATENHNLNKDLRAWKEAYVKLQSEYEDLKKETEPKKKTTRKKKEE
jgi:predicted nuclease with TOPRIM domain